MLTQLLATLLLQTTAAADDFEPGALFGRVADTLGSSYHDRQFRKADLPALVAEYRPYAMAAGSLAEEKAWVDAFLARIPASHLALLTKAVHRRMMAELQNQPRPTLGCEVEQRGSRFFVFRLSEGGAAEAAGVLRGDRVVAVDQVPVVQSPLLMGSSDDAALPDAPLHGFEVESGQEVELLIERSPGERRTLRVTARRMCALDAMKNSVRVVEEAGRRIGYIHFPYFQMTGPTAALRELLDEDFKDCDALVLDLRGRGGNALEVQSMLALFHGKRPRWTRPMVALVDRCTRSAKEAFAFDVRRHKVGTLVGEHTAGALIPASFQDVGQGFMLMYPGMKLGDYTEQVELKGIEPDVLVADSGPYAAGADPILVAGLRVAADLAAASAR
jgi:carboxyl-terminal processing protease